MAQSHLSSAMHQYHYNTNNKQRSRQQKGGGLNINKTSSFPVSRAMNPTQLKLQKKLADGMMTVTHAKQSVGFLEADPGKAADC